MVLNKNSVSPCQILNGQIEREQWRNNFFKYLLLTESKKIQLIFSYPRQFYDPLLFFRPAHIQVPVLARHISLYDCKKGHEEDFLLKLKTENSLNFVCIMFSVPVDIYTQQIWFEFAQSGT